MSECRTLILALALLSGLFLRAVQAQPTQELPSNPFTTPQAKVRYAPDRDYDLLHVALDLKIDYEQRAFQAAVCRKWDTI